MKILQLVISAIVAYAVPRALDALRKRDTAERREAKPLDVAFPWIQWCLAHTIGGAVGGVLSGLIAMAGLTSPGGLGNWSVYGAAVGIAQWVVLRRYVPISPFWAVASAFSWSAWAIVQSAEAPATWGWLVVGITVGVLQWLLLRRHRQRAFWWIPVNAVAWVLAGGIATAVGFALIDAGASLQEAWVVGWAIVGLVGGAIIGVALSKMPRR